jgi:transcriptional pleiotropic repressor
MAASPSILAQFREMSDAFRVLQEDAEAGYAPIVDLLSRILDAHVTVADLGGTELAQAGTAAWSTSPVRSSRRSGAAVLEQPIMTVPVYAGRSQAGAVLVERPERDFTETEQVLVEYAATLVGLILHDAGSRESAEQSRRRASVRIAMDALSYSEQAAAKRLFQALDGPQGLVVTSHIADEMGITRSVIVNALRKLESAGVIETRSLGMKGTFIRVLNPLLAPAFEQLSI